MRGLAWILLGAFVLAGCAGSTPAPAGGEVPTSGVPSASVDPTSPTGCIRGIVVDEAIRPIPNVNITFAPTGKVVRTDANGGFAVCGLDPGTYILRCARDGYTATQSSTLVKAGEAATVRIAMLIDAVAKPYHDTQRFRGHIDDYLGFPQFAAQLVVDTFAPGTLPPCVCEWDLTANAGLRTIVLDADGSVTVHEPSGGLLYGDAYWEFISNYLQNGQNPQTGYAYFPFTVHLDEESVFGNGTTNFHARLTGGAWASGTMDYELFVTFWYKEKAPADWTFFKEVQ